MRQEIGHKRERLGAHVPGFLGYSAIHYLETDRVLRRHLCALLRDVRDRLAGVLSDWPAAAADRPLLARALRALAALQRNVSAAAGSPAAGPPRGADEERLLDLDLVLLDKVAGLQTPIEALSAGVLTAQEGAALVDEAIRELSGLWGRRTLLLAGLESGGTDAGTGDSQ